jgi:hypothetical protein
MKIYSLNWVQLSYDFDKVISNGTNYDLHLFFFIFLYSWVIIMLISFGIKFLLVHIYMVYNDAIEVKQLGIYEYLILVILFR